MRITDLVVFPVQGRHWPRFPMVFVEVHTDAGLIGLGEALHYRTTGLRESLAAARELLVGRDPLQIELHFETLFRGGVNMAAVSGIETALWDILGQVTGQPLYNLLGGRCHDRIRVYVDGFFRGADYIATEYAEKAAEAVAEGYTALKMDVDEPIPMGRRFNRGLTPADLRHCVRMVESVRETVGPDVDLAVDAHGAFDLPSAVRLGRALEDQRLLWIEDPLPMNNLEAMARVALEVETPICTGELLETRFQFRELFALHSADIIMPDLARCGGVLELKKIAAMADAHLIPVAPHNMVGPVATIASMHVCAATPNFLVLEYQLGDVEWIDDLLTQPVPIRDGHLELFETPGLGVALNHTAVERYRAD